MVEQLRTVFLNGIMIRCPPIVLHGGSVRDAQAPATPSILGAILDPNTGTQISPYSTEVALTIASSARTIIFASCRRRRSLRFRLKALLQELLGMCRVSAISVGTHPLRCRMLFEQASSLLRRRKRTDGSCGFAGRQMVI